MSDQDRKASTQGDKFVRHGAMKPASMFSEYFHFLKTSKKWWLLPLIAVFLLFGLFIVLSSSGAAPFIYTLF